jgi:multidrug resistance efflux pump
MSKAIQSSQLQLQPLLLSVCLQERIQDLKVQLAALVDSFEQQCGTFCNAFSRPQLEKRQAEIQQQEQQAEACLQAAQQQLQAKGKQLTQQKAAMKQLQQQVADSRAIIKGISLLALCAFTESY